MKELQFKSVLGESILSGCPKIYWDKVDLIEVCSAHKKIVTSEKIILKTVTDLLNKVGS